ncbi:MAG: chitobiase/beta-hexosaminidase C-terminal domain-containing protein [Roseburia sp.]|nr:chitobiase/beta-hexosaminidase C-terminal domain-containing protein [Roseburia sp.]MCM1277921.1 chitobiase/beta-hexosaminidase C-terminal domain-containing protein [Robinsoniella sp.]
MRMKKSIWKKTLSAVLSLAMAVGLLASASKPLTAEAAASTPSMTKFATRNELMNSRKFNLDGSGTAQLVYFGNKSGSHDSQTWYIAGYDPVVEAIVLICDPQSPLVYSMSFTTKGGFRTELDIDGIYEGQMPSTVCTNHYGASDLRATLRSLSSDLYFFSKSEQKLMEATTIYTYDKENSTVYATRDKLYAAYGEGNNSSSYIAVGSNSSAAALLNQGLRISLSQGPFHSSYNYFWLRSPNTSYSDSAYYVSSGYISYSTVKGSSHAVVPAFAFNAESVLFGSAVPVEADEPNGFKEGMTMRLDDSAYGKIISTADYTYDSNGDVDGVVVQKSRSESTDSYLCIQGKDETGDWCYSKKIAGRQEIKFASLDHEAAAENCKIWIETTVDNLTYAKMIGSAAPPTASVSSGSYTADQSVVLSTLTKDATIYYTTNGEVPTTDSNRYTKPISVKGKPGESIETTIRAIAVRDDLDASMESSFHYVIELPHAHSWSKAWTNDRRGHWHECTTPNCTVSENSGNYGYAAHTEDEGTVTTQPTEKETGVRTYQCSVCGYEMRKETIPATGKKEEHTHSWSKAWTSDRSGHWHECTTPDCTVSENSGNYGYAAHTEDEGTVTTQPTEKETGVRTYQCSVCGYEMRKETIPATGKNEDEGNKGDNDNKGDDDNNKDDNGNKGDDDNNKDDNGNKGDDDNNKDDNGNKGDNDNKVDNDNKDDNGNNNNNNNNSYAAKPAAKNTVLTAASQKCLVKVTSSSITNPTVAYAGSTNSKAATISVPATVTVNGITYKVTSVGTGALANNKKVTKVTIGKNVVSIEKNAFKNCTKLKTVTINSTVLNKIGANAFFGDKSLKTITIKSTKLTSKAIGKNALKGTNSKLIVKAPKKKVSAYKKFFKNKGNKKVTVK